MNRVIIRSSSPGGAFTVATLPSSSAMEAESQGTMAYTSDAGTCVWSGTAWTVIGSASAAGAASTIATRRAANIAGHLKGPAVIAPPWAATTPYTAASVVTVANGLHLYCATAGTSGATIPTYGGAVLNGRPLIDGTVTWYALPWSKMASDPNAPTITSGASAAAVGLVKTQVVSGGVIIPGPTGFSAKQSNFANALIRHYQFALGTSLASGNCTGDATGDGYSNAYAYNVLQWDMEFYVTDSKFGIVLGPSAGSIYLEVDGQMIQGSQVQLPTNGCLALDYNGVVKRRLVRISDVQVGAAINGVAMTAQGILEPSDSPNDCMLLLGDSLFNTVSPGLGTAITAPQGFWLQRLLGITSMVNASVGGSGYVNAVANSFNVSAVLANPENQRLFASYAPSHIVIEAAYNDLAISWATVGPAALSAWQAARAQFPNAKITILDGFAEATGPSALALTMAGNLLALFNTWGDGNSRFIQTIGPSVATSWMQGTGKTSAALSSGNASNFVGTDGTHPSPAGAYYLAARLAGAINAAWNGGY